MANPDILFRGIPRGPTRGFTADVLRLVRPERVIIPCCGSFSLAYTALQAGIPAAAIRTSDISLYSTALGQAILGEDWRLDVVGEVAEPVRAYLTDPISKAAAVLWVLRYLQYHNKAAKIHHRDKARELLANLPVYLEQLREQVARMAETLKGLFYRPRDLWEEAEEYRHDPGALFLFNPPRYSGGYDRMFKGIDEAFSWDQPHVPQFTEKDYRRLVDLLGTSPAQTLLYYASQGDDPADEWGPPWVSLFADRPASRLIALNWIVSNRDLDRTAITRARLEEGAAKFKLFDGEIAEHTDLRAVRVSKAVGEYYKDLFIHRLPGSMTEVYAAVLLDGCLLGIVGCHLYNFRAVGVDQPANITFAFSVPHERYGRLHKLLLMALTSSWFWDDILSTENWYAVVGRPAQVQSTMLTPHPENKTARGVMQLAKREPQKDGSYKLSYYADVIERTREETVNEWRKRFGT